MKFNESVIPHYILERVKIEALKKMVKISPDHLKEKSSWFIIDGRLCYFKERDEARMFTEVFCEEFGKLLGFSMAEYSLAYISEKETGGRKGESKFGLISPNYQLPQYNYYLASDLMNSQISNLGIYGGYSLENLLQYVGTEFGEISGVLETQQSLVNMYIFDYFTGQTDRNPKNVCFEVEAKPSADKNYWGLHGRKVTKIRMATMFDNEKSLGLLKTPSGYTLNDSSLDWQTAFPYSLNTDDFGEFGFDPNILQLYFENEKLAKPLMERLAYDDEYRKIIEHFEKINGKMVIDPQTKKHLIALFLGRQNELKRLLKM